MTNRHRAVKVWLRGFVMFVVGAGLGLTIWVLTPHPWSFVIALGVGGLFFALGGRGLLWVWRYRREQRRKERRQ